MSEGEREPPTPVAELTTERSHRVSESADKIRLDTKIKRGEGTRDQDTIKVQVKGDSPEDVADDLNETLEELAEVPDTLRQMQAGEDGGE